MPYTENDLDGKCPRCGVDGYLVAYTENVDPYDQGYGDKHPEGDHIQCKGCGAKFTVEADYSYEGPEDGGWKGGMYPGTQIHSKPKYPQSPDDVAGQMGDY
jgi:ribosomal protein L37E